LASSSRKFDLSGGNDAAFLGVTAADAEANRPTRKKVLKTRQTHAGRQPIWSRWIGRQIHRSGIQVTLILSLLSLFQTLGQTPESTRPAPAKATTQGAESILVKPKPGTSKEELDRYHAEYRCDVLKRFPGFGDVQVLGVPEGESVQEAVQRYHNSGLVEYAEPDYHIRVASVFPNDPRFLDGTLWSLNNAGQDGGLANADIDAPEAWSVRTSASNVIVAVIDSGIRYTHEDLAANMWTNPRDGSHGLNALTGSSDPDDDNGHGTRVAGVIGAVGNNGIGVVGVAWRVQLMACKFVNSFGYGTVARALACLDYARTNGAHIINASWGLDDSLSLSNAMVALKASGIIVVAAAGNGPRNIDLTPHYPASYDLENIITVAATTRHDALYGLSNFGASNVDLAAPGDEVYSTQFKSDSAYSFDVFQQGDTSMAAAYVSGAVALLRAVHPSETPAQIKQRLLAATDSLPGLAGKCVSGGRLNLRKALGVAVSTPVLNIVASPTGPPALLLFGDPGRHYVVEASSNDGKWWVVCSNLTGLSGSFTNRFAPNAAWRYRARLAP